jgi:hypothetical protein
VAVRGLLLVARRFGLSIERLDLRNSGDTAGARDRVVGYGAWALYPAVGHDDESAVVEAQAATLLGLARMGIAIGFDTGQPGHVNIDKNLPPLLSAQGAAFVTLRRNGQLRGCIGSVVATRPLVADVVLHAFNAAFRDWRFPPLNLLEVPGLDLSVSMLTPPVPMQFANEADLLAQLRPRTDGLIIGDAGHRAVFLPMVWDELPDRRHFLIALKRKAGLRDNHFSSGFTAQRFRSIEVKGSMANSPSSAGGRDRFAWTAFRSRA